MPAYDPFKRLVNEQPASSGKMRPARENIIHGTGMVRKAARRTPGHGDLRRNNVSPGTVGLISYQRSKKNLRHRAWPNGTLPKASLITQAGMS